MHVYLTKHQSAAAMPGMLQINAEVHWVTQEEVKCRGQVLQADDASAAQIWHCSISAWFRLTI